MSTENALLVILKEKIQEDAVVLPTLPEVAIRVRDVADDPRTNLNDVAQVVAVDPALSARLIRVANSAYNARAVAVDTVPAAVNRIGLQAIKNVAIAMALEQLFVSCNDIVELYLRKTWEQSVTVASAAVAAASLADDQRRGVRLDVLALAGLLHDIGTLPILSEAEIHDDIFANPRFIDSARRQLGPAIGLAILQRWQLGDEFEQVINQLEQPELVAGDVQNSDYVRLGLLYHQWAEGKVDELKLAMQPYVEKGLVDDEMLFKSSDFTEAFSKQKSLYSD